MPRVKRGVTARARHKKVLKKAKGFRGRRGNVFRVAKEAVMKAGQYAYRDRRAKKRDFRALWIARINAAARQNGLSYSHFMNGLKRAVLPVVAFQKKVDDLAVMLELVDAASAGGRSTRISVTPADSSTLRNFCITSSTPVTHAWSLMSSCGDSTARSRSSSTGRKLRMLAVSW